MYPCQGYLFLGCESCILVSIKWECLAYPEGSGKKLHHWGKQFWCRQKKSSLRDQKTRVGISALQFKNSVTIVTWPLWTSLYSAKQDGNIYVAGFVGRIILKLLVRTWLCSPFLSILHIQNTNSPYPSNTFSESSALQSALHISALSGLIESYEIGILSIIL